MAEDVNLQASGYDEDLCENPFFKYMQTKQKQIYEEAASKRWTVGLITQIFGIEFLQKTDTNVTSLLLFTELINLSPLHFSVIINVTSRVNLGKCLIKIFFWRAIRVIPTARQRGGLSTFQVLQPVLVC